MNQALVREIDRLLEFHGEEVRRLQLTVLRDSIRKHRDTWIVPVMVGTANGDASSLTDLLRVLRRSLENKLQEPVSVLLDVGMDD